MACETAEEKKEYSKPTDAFLHSQHPVFVLGKNQKKLQTHWNLLNTRASSEGVKVPFFVESTDAIWVQGRSERIVVKCLPITEGARGRFLRSTEKILKMGTQPSMANAAWPFLTQHGENKEYPSCLDTWHQDHTQQLCSLVLLGVDDWGSFPAWDFMCEAYSVYRNCWDFQRVWLKLKAGKWTQETVARNQGEAHEDNKMDVHTGTSSGAAQCWQADLDVSHLSASQLLTHGTSTPICQESHSLLLECSHLWSRTQQLFKELTETNQGQDAKTQPKCRGKQGGKNVNQVNRVSVVVIIKW